LQRVQGLIHRKSSKAGTGWLRRIEMRGPEGRREFKASRAIGKVDGASVAEKKRFVNVLGAFTLGLDEQTEKFSGLVGHQNASSFS